MSLNKSIEHGKEHRKPYKGSKQYDPSCCNHGTCFWCQRNRRYREYKDKEKEKEKYSLDEYKLKDEF